ncbi:hypothetical protein BCV70DRAFT_202853 [Testicularia cyperi]|uniref:Uncharacterized protein n=1 Tax=Testicularia cyperi TaxID=1882483 RepID=A0A317XH71_9BASI|nr:hypothetical protein BCV70DRAFT_202853 [Testicularia cyperi]
MLRHKQAQTNTKQHGERSKATPKRTQKRHKKQRESEQRRNPSPEVDVGAQTVG